MSQTPDHRSRVAAQRRERMRDHLLQQALGLLARVGPEAAQIDDIVRAADVSRGTFYKYYESPAALVRELALRLSEDVILTVTKLSQQHQDPALRAAVGMKAVLGLVARCPVLGGFILRAGWPLSDPSHAFFRIVGPNVQAGLAQGRFAPQPPALGEMLVSGLAVGAMAVIVQGGAGPGFAAAATEMLLRGLGLSAEEAARLAQVEVPSPEPEAGSFLARVMAASAP